MVEDDRDKCNKSYGGNFIKVVHPDERTNVLNAIEEVNNGVK